MGQSVSGEGIMRILAIVHNPCTAPTQWKLRIRRRSSFSGTTCGGSRCRRSHRGSTGTLPRRSSGMSIPRDQDGAAALLTRLRLLGCDWMRRRARVWTLCTSPGKRWAITSRSALCAHESYWNHRWTRAAGPSDRSHGRSQSRGGCGRSGGSLCGCLSFNLSD